jgi:hypothetical protein
MVSVLASGPSACPKNARDITVVKTAHCFSFSFSFFSSGDYVSTSEGVRKNKQTNNSIQCSEFTDMAQFAHQGNMVSNILTYTSIKL